jgi:hypothetical protein
MSVFLTEASSFDPITRSAGPLAAEKKAAPEGAASRELGRSAYLASLEAGA